MTVTMLRHLFQRSCNITTRPALVIGAVSSNSSGNNNNNNNYNYKYITTIPSSHSNATRNYSTFPSSVSRVKLSSRERKLKIFRVLKANEKYKRHSNFYGNRLRVSVNETYIAQLLDAYADKRTFRPAIKMYDRLRSKRLIPSVYAYRKFLFTVGYRGRQTEEAERIFQDMLEGRTSSIEDRRRMREDRYCHNIMMHVYASNIGGMEGYEKARKLFDAMAQSNNEYFRPNSFSYFYLLRCFAPRGAASTAAATTTTEGEQQQQTYHLEETDKQVVRDIITEMLADNVLLVSNRHIKAVLERLGMHDEVDQIYASMKENVKE